MTPPPGPSKPRIRVDVAAVADGYAVTLDGPPVKTPGKRPMVVPGAALAQEIAHEIERLVAEDPAALASLGLGDPAQAPNFRIAAAAIDVIAGEAGARVRVVADLAAYGVTDLVCFRAERPEGLVAAQQAAWAPLVDWFAGEFGVRLGVTTGLRAVPQEPAALAAIIAAIEGVDDFALAALSLATRAAGSMVIGLALLRGRLDADIALMASTVDEIYQAERWGTDEDSSLALEAKALDLAQAARFLDLLAKG
ncbi:MAG: ATPase [Alphaproteobacteria bacterium]|nr:ATPase [Alphaproteobacteria bacterium]